MSGKPFFSHGNGKESLLDLPRCLLRPMLPVSQATTVQKKNSPFQSRRGSGKLEKPTNVSVGDGAWGVLVKATIISPGEKAHRFPF